MVGVMVQISLKDMTLLAMIMMVATVMAEMLTVLNHSGLTNIMHIMLRS